MFCGASIKAKASWGTMRISRSGIHWFLVLRTTRGLGGSISKGALRYLEERSEARRSILTSANEKTIDFLKFELKKYVLGNFVPLKLETSVSYLDSPLTKLMVQPTDRAFIYNDIKPKRSLITSLGATKRQRDYEHGLLVLGLQRFSEHLSGSAFSLVIFRDLVSVATPAWLIDMASFHYRLVQIFKLTRSKNPMSVLSPKHPWYGGAKVIISSIYSRDPFLLAIWIRKKLKRMRLFSHRKFLRLLGTFLRYFVNLQPEEGKILGFNFVTTGKISVTGNAMSRTMLVRYGKAGINNLSYRASSAFTLIKTKTGCLGLVLVFYY